MSSAKPMSGKEVQGYRTLSDADISMMNSLKAASRNFLSELELVSANSEYDRRWIAIAKTQMQQACMAACRAVSRPDDDC